MKRITLGIGILALLLLLFAGAFAFSVTLQNLHVSAYSFAQPAEAAVITAPMTGADESAISSPSTDSVRMERFDHSTHVCEKDKAPDSATDF